VSGLAFAPMRGLASRTRRSMKRSAMVRRRAGTHGSCGGQFAWVPVLQRIVSRCAAPGTRA
jgi:hypothetical protein